MLPTIEPSIVLTIALYGIRRF